MPHPRLMLVDPGQQGGPGGATPARVVKLRKPQPIESEFVENRRLDLPAIAAEIRIAGIVRHDHHDVGLFLSDQGRSCQEGKEEKRN